MRFASARQVILMIALSAVSLFALDYWKNPQLWHHGHAAAEQNGGALLTLSMNRACSPAELRQALSGTDGLDLANTIVLAGEEDSSNSGNAITVRVLDMEKVDFTALDRALRQNGLVAGRMDLSGVPHFGLQAEFPPLTGLTDQSVEERITFVKAQGMGQQLEWLDSVNMDAQNHALTVYARYVEPGKSVNVAELVTGLNDIGLAPTSLHVMIGDPHSVAAAK